VVDVLLPRGKYVHSVRPSVDPEDFADPGFVHGIRDHERFLPDPAVLTDALDLRVQPQVRVGAVQRAPSERVDLLIQPAAHVRDLVLGEPPEAHLLDQPIDLARAHAVDVRLLNDRDQRLLRAAARLKERRQIAPSPKARDLQLDLPNPGVPGALAIPIALRLPAPRRTLAELRARKLGDLKLLISRTINATDSRNTSACSLASTSRTASRAVRL